MENRLPDFAGAHNQDIIVFPYTGSCRCMKSDSKNLNKGSMLIGYMAWNFINHM